MQTDAIKLYASRILHWIVLIKILIAKELDKVFATDSNCFQKIVMLIFGVYLLPKRITFVLLLPSKRCHGNGDRARLRSTRVSLRGSPVQTRPGSPHITLFVSGSASAWEPSSEGEATLNLVRAAA